jgi:hypothetical protein
MAAGVILDYYDTGKRRCFKFLLGEVAMKRIRRSSKWTTGYWFGSGDKKRSGCDLGEVGDNIEE